MARDVRRHGQARLLRHPGGLLSGGLIAAQQCSHCIIFEPAGRGQILFDIGQPAVSDEQLGSNPRFSSRLEQHGRALHDDADRVGDIARSAGSNRSDGYGHEERDDQHAGQRQPAHSPRQRQAEPPRGRRRGLDRAPALTEQRCAQCCLGLIALCVGQAVGVHPLQAHGCTQQGRQLGCFSPVTSQAVGCGLPGL